MPRRRPTSSGRSRADLVFVVEHEVTEGPEGIVRYHIASIGGRRGCTPGPAARLMRASPGHATAVAVGSGEINAQSAFMTGRLRCGATWRS